MSRRELDFVRAEIATLEGFLRALPEDEIIERAGLERRLERARHDLAELEKQPRPKLLPITFRGAPVQGTYSIEANFASTALKHFIEATDTVAASLGSDELKGFGRLPGVRDRSLRIVDTAVGSFGFELELPPLVVADGVALPPGSESNDPYARAIETTLSLIRKAAAADEEAMSDLIADIHPRAATKVRAFAKVLADNDALFAAEFEGRRIQLETREEVQRVMDAPEGRRYRRTARNSAWQALGRASGVTRLRVPPDR